MIKKIKDIAEFEKQDGNYKLLTVTTANCGACKMMAPILAEIQETTEFEVFEIDGIANKQAVTELKVQTVPAILVYIDDELVDRFLGYIPAAKLQNELVALID